MSRGICLSVWLVRSVTLALLDPRSAALLQNESAPHHCYSCDPPAGPPGEACSSAPAPPPHAPPPLAPARVTLCPADQPYCATVASTPNMTSSLTCAAATQPHCSLSYTARTQSYELTCVCAGDRCNAPFSRELRQQLLTFAATREPQNETLDLTEVFLKESTFSNQTRTTMYKAITMKLKEVNPTTARTTTLADKSERARLEVPPRAEALKQGASPFDDDDDEGDGSGDEEVRGRVRGSPPADPSSHLPAEGGGGGGATFLCATSSLLNVLATSAVLLHVVVV